MVARQLGLRLGYSLVLGPLMISGLAG